MKHSFILTLALIASVGLSACADYQGPEIKKQDAGAVTGAIIGGVLGSNIGDGKGQLIAVGVGTLVGGLIGSEVGKSLDRADMAYANQANTRAHSAPIGETISWNNPESGNSGSVTPVRDGRAAGGEYCREYEQTIYVDGRSETATGIACKKPDGTWDIVG